MASTSENQPDREGKPPIPTAAACDALVGFEAACKAIIAEGVSGSTLRAFRNESPDVGRVVESITLADAMLAARAIAPAEAPFRTVTAPDGQPVRTAFDLAFELEDLARKTAFAAAAVVHAANALSDDGLHAIADNVSDLARQLDRRIADVANGRDREAAE